MQKYMLRPFREGEHLQPDKLYVCPDRFFVYVPYDLPDDHPYVSCRVFKPTSDSFEQAGTHGNCGGQRSSKYRVVNGSCADYSDVKTNVRWVVIDAEEYDSLPAAERLSVTLYKDVPPT